MKKYILTLLATAILLGITGCPKASENKVPEPEKSNVEESAPVESSEVGSVIESEPDNKENNTTSTTVITPETEPYEWEEAIPDDPEGDHICEEPIAMEPQLDYKPVIYLYPTEETDIEVILNYNGTLTTTYPKYDNGWTITAHPDGTLTANGREYYCLFWEGKPNVEYDLTKGFCIKGEDTEEFLEKSLKELGLTDKEANEFIVFWLPKMENNKYNIISFQNELYTENAKLNVTPAPDTVIRVFMAWKASDEFKEMEAQALTSPKRNGFTLVEWGGTQIRN